MKILFVLGVDEYLKRLEGKIRKCLFFYVKQCGTEPNTLGFLVQTRTQVLSSGHGSRLSKSRVSLCQDFYTFLRSCLDIAQGLRTPDQAFYVKLLGLVRQIRLMIFFRPVVFLQKNLWFSGSPPLTGFSNNTVF